MNKATSKTAAPTLAPGDPNAAVAMTPAQAVELAGRAFGEGRFPDAARICQQGICKKSAQHRLQSDVSAMQAISHKSSILALVKGCRQQG